MSLAAAIDVFGAECCWSDAIVQSATMEAIVKHLRMKAHDRRILPTSKRYKEK